MPQKRIEWGPRRVPDAASPPDAPDAPEVPEMVERGVFTLPYRSAAGAVLAVAVDSRGRRVAEMEVTGTWTETSRTLWAALDAAQPRPRLELVR